MSAHVMRNDRPLFATKDPARGTDVEVRAAFEGYVSYFGTYTIDPQTQTVTHHVRGASFPNWIGSVRFFQDVARGSKEFGNCFVFQRGNLRCRMNSCAAKNFIRVNIDDPGDQLLLHENRFHCAAMFSENILELRKIDI